MFINRFLKALVAVASLASLQVQAGVHIQQWQTSNGAEVYFVENHDLPIIDLSVNFSAGNARDDQPKAGVAGMTRYLMTLGAAGLSDEVIAQRLAEVGAQLGGDIDSDMASFKLRSLSSAPEFEKALGIYTKILQKPDFPEAVLTREKSRVIASLKEAATQPASIASDAFMKALYANHPYGLDSTPETVAPIKREDLQKFYVNYYGAKGAVIALIGDISRDQAEKIAESISSGLPSAEKPAAIPEVVYPEQASEERIAHPAKQSHILLGYPGVKRGDADYFPLYVGNYILGGGGFVSRLTEEVREKRGLVYSVYSYFLPMAQLGPFQIGLQTKREQSDDALKLVRETLANFINKGVTESELKAAKQNITGGFPLRLDSNAKILDYLAVIGFYKLPLTYLDDFNEQINKVTAAQIKDAFSRRVNPDKMVTVIVAGGAN
ncbi:zinc protease [Methylovorus sp. MM2]|uniref:M16 family metallopeptidase n=1 Tax=Methylovorus sp. MM2 TaxID=1848038 RepID=UPI0007DEA382|nr:pitrilysin family protein [Methylovorus sp. MM2]OAM52495.1 zinc protease [Methylovorus sp. MM2]